jgi:diketogulonate reductase-like aldo/keto reductase
MIDGVRVPTFFYGTAWKEADTERLTSQALALGFRAIDTANQRKHYVEAAAGAAVARALARGAVTRDELFLQTKFTHIDGQDQRLPYDPRADVRTQVQQSFASSLDHLCTDYLDSYVLHGPSRRRGLAPADREAYGAMAELQRAGRVRLLGVSNVALDQLEEFCASPSGPPAFVQNRCYAQTGWDRDVRELCRRHGIAYQGFSLLTANRQVLASPALLRIAKRLGATPAQVVFRFALELGMLPLTGTSSEEHARSDLAAYDLEGLGEDERAALERIGIG